MHPFIITASIWFLLHLSYEIFASIYPRIPHLSPLAYSYIALYLLVFFVVSELIIRKRVKLRLKKIVNAPKILNGRVKFCFYFIFLCNLFLIFRFMIFTGQYNILGVISKFRAMVTSSVPIPIDMKLLFYIFNLTFVLLIYYYLYRPRINPYLKIAVILEFGIILLCISTKGKLLKYIVAVLVLLYVKRKLTPKIMLYFLIFGVGAVVLLVLIRDAAFFKTGYYSLADYLYIYVLTPFPSLDLLIHGHVPFTTEPIGGRTLVFFYRILNVFTHIELPDDRPGTMFLTVQGPNVALPTNVYTSLGNFYMDWGWIGIVFYAVLCSLLFSILYKNINRRFFLFVYVLTIFSLVFNFFGDFCFQFFSMTIQDIVAVLVVFSFRKVRKPIKV
ncbi:MAG: oligosaccharide repeat unit polymerase [Bacteroidaceae bacterium]|nr:oligosaccharide repeat unit polymerase [Bacteroidaceae bacterium]